MPPGNPRSDPPAGVRCGENARHPSGDAPSEPGVRPNRFRRSVSCVVVPVAQALEQIGFEAATSVNQTEGTVELLRAPKGAVMLFGEMRKLPGDRHLALVATDSAPHLR